MLPLSLTSPGDLQAGIGRRAQQLRLELDITQAELARRAGVAIRTLRRFEATGQASLEHVVRIAFALQAEAGFEALFPARPPQTIDDIISAQPRQRVRHK